MIFREPTRETLNKYNLCVYNCAKKLSKEVEAVAARKDEENAGSGKSAAVERRERLAAELRANLKKRKARSRTAQREEADNTKKP